MSDVMREMFQYFVIFAVVARGNDTEAEIYFGKTLPEDITEIEFIGLRLVQGVECGYELVMDSVSNKWREIL